MTLYEAIFCRRSVRSYRMEAIDKAILENIPKFMEEVTPLFPEINTQLKIIDRVEKKEKVSGLTNVRAPYYAAFYSEKKERSDMNAGFLMEYLSLYLESRGLGTCFLGTASKKDKEEEEAGRSFVMILAFGKPKNAAGRKDYDVNRLSLEKLCAYKESPKAQIRQLLEAARLAPSAMNVQPWRFVVYENRIHVFSKKPMDAKGMAGKYTEFNFGVMFANVMVAAEELWVDVDLIRLGNITHMSLPNNQYVLSILLKP